ncbi:hypothetical protein [Aurantimonas sp. A2-1-M11]|uniref:hypothetical protein n=1 Tax=Aurantimonas sp. A2-1-M11 TaxID=3113712 RepID=UPI003FA59AA8
MRSPSGVARHEPLRTSPGCSTHRVVFCVCPLCGSGLVRLPGEAALRCVGKVR